MFFSFFILGDLNFSFSACNICFTTLIEQWNLYERNNTALTKRLYWLKRVDERHFTGSDAHHHSNDPTRPPNLDNDMDHNATVCEMADLLHGPFLLSIPPRTDYMTIGRVSGLVLLE